MDSDDAPETMFGTAKEHDLFMAPRLHLSEQAHEELLVLLPEPGRHRALLYGRKSLVEMLTKLRHTLEYLGGLLPVLLGGPHAPSEWISGAESGCGWW